MKRIWSRSVAFLLTLVFLAGCIPFAVSADENGFVYSVANGEATITDYKGNAEHLVIPETLGGYPVTAIEAFAFDECSMISVEIPGCVRTIGGGAFYLCEALTTVKFSYGLETIEETAFGDCTSLKEAILPSSVCALSPEMFSGCDSMTVITIDPGCKEYVAVGNCVIRVSDGCLIQGCAGSVIPADGSVKKIAASAFAGVRNLTSVKIPDSVVEIGNYAFDSTALTELYIPATVKKLGKYVVYYSKVTTVYCGAASKPAGWDAKWLGGVDAEVVWGYEPPPCPHTEKSTVEVVAPTCTQSGLTRTTCRLCGEVLEENETLPLAHNKTVEKRQEPTCTKDGWLKTVCALCGEELSHKNLLATGHTSGKPGVDREPTCTKPGYSGLSCTVCGEGLGGEEIPAKGHDYGKDGRCTVCGTAKGDAQSDFTYEITDEGVIITGYTGDKANVKVPGEIQGLPVIKIGDAAFDGADVETISFPTTLREIGMFAFEGCTSLKKVSIPGNVKIIGGSAFMDCSGLESLFLGEGVETIGSGAFSGCTKLSSVMFPASLTVLEDSALLGCDGLKYLGVAEGNTVFASAGNCIIERSTGTLLVGCAASVIPQDGSVTKIGDGAFTCVKNLTNLTIPDCITAIGKDAFRSSGLEYVYIPASVEKIGAYAFFDMKALKTIYCQAEEAPAGWVEKWNNGCDAEIVWGYKTCKHEYTYISAMCEATCENGGYTVHSCRSCSQVIRREEFAATGHKYDKKGKCANCGNVEGLVIEITAGYVLIVSYRGDAKALEIPSEIEGLPVMGIQAGAFDGNTTLTSVFIPSTVESVEAGAFAGCENLGEIRCETESMPSTWAEGWAGDAGADVAWESAPKPTVMYGDVSGDNRIAIVDYVLLKRYVMGTTTLNDSQLGAADVNRDGKIAVGDYVLLKRHVLGTFVIKQD